jgi:uncharacterized protein YjiS (DUF1127 family)
MFRKLKAYTHRRQTRRELEQLSDKELADIGISRSDIPAILKTIN